MLRNYLYSGAESINFALKGFMELTLKKGTHCEPETEHKANRTCEFLETKGVEVTHFR
jgi:cysteine sulfinate desulfinase/cysteine desulfurase-like protein